MADERKTEPWEVEPYGDTDLNYAIWLDDYKGQSRIQLSNQNDANEAITLCGPQEIGELIARLEVAKRRLEEIRGSVPVTSTDDPSA